MLSVIYPLLLTQIVLSALDRYIPKTTVYRGAAVGALLYCVPEALCSFGLPLSFVKAMPLAGLGFGWILPAMLGALIGLLLPNRDAAGASTALPKPENQSRPRGERVSGEDSVTIITIIPPAVSSKS